MLVGDPTMRSRPDTKLKRQNCFRCYTGPNFGGDVGAPCMDDSVDTEALPNKPCPGGIRSNILFPTYAFHFFFLPSCALPCPFLQYSDKR